MCPSSIRNARGDQDDDKEESEGAHNSDDDMADFLHDIILLVSVLGMDGPVMECKFNEDDFHEHDFQPIDVFATDSPIDISVHVPKVVENKNTYETFCCTTLQSPWVPFSALKDASTWTQLDKAEHKLFDEMSPSYLRTAGLDTAKGYKTFAKAWDLQVANLYSAAVSGHSGIQRVNRKSYIQLQQHCDNLKKHKEPLAKSASINNDKHMKQVEGVFRSTRRELGPINQRRTSLQM